MKYLVCLSIITLFTCGGKPSNTIEIKGMATYSLSIGYGNIYGCVLQEKTDRKSIPDTLSLVFMVGDPLEKQLKENQTQAFTFTKEKENVPYSHMPTTGFVDKEMTLWKLTSIE